MLNRSSAKMVTILVLFATPSSAQDMDALERCSQVGAVAEVTMSARQSGIRKDVLLAALAQSPDPELVHGIITRAYEVIIWGDPILREIVVMDFSGQEELTCLDASGL
jgi:hypothetical protein